MHALVTALTAALIAVPPASARAKAGTGPSAPVVALIRGRVLDVRGPVAGAHVFATRRPPRDPSAGDDERLLAAASGSEVPPYLAETLTDDEGRFTVAGLPPGLVDLWAEAPGRGVALEEWVPVGGDTLELHLHAGLELAGSVLDERKRPLAGAAVSAIDLEHGRLYRGRSNADGRVELGVVEATQRLAVVGLTEGRTFDSTRFGRFGDVLLTAFELHVGTPQALHGRVLAHGCGVAGATVEAREARTGRSTFTTTDERGAFAFASLAAGELTVTAQSGDLSGRTDLELPGNGDPVELVVEPRPTLEVFVADPAGRPQRHALVIALGEVTETFWQASTNDEGLARFVALGRGNYRIGVGEPQASLSTLRFVDARAESGVTRVRVRWPETPGFAGVVVDASGSPVPGAVVHVGSIVHACCDDLPRTDEQGRFAVHGRADGGLETLSFVAPGFVGRDVRTRADGDLRVVLSRGLSLRGRVVGEDGAPIFDANVTCEGPPPSAGAATTRQDGTFTVRGLTKGRHAVSAYDPETGRMAEATVTLGRSPPPELVLRLPGRLETRVQVQDELAAPLAGVAVEMAMSYRGTDGRESVSVFGRRTDEKGTASFHALTPGERRITARLPGFDDAESRVAAGEETTIVLHRTPHLVGRVLGPDGTPARAVAVDAVRVEDTDGRFVIERPTRPRVTISAAGFAPRLVEVRDGRRENVDLGTLVLEPARTFRVRLVDAGSGAPVTNASVWVLFPQQPGSVNTREFLERRLEPGAKHPDEDGWLALERVPGRVALRVSATGYRLTETLVSPDDSVVRLEPSPNR